MTKACYRPPGYHKPRRGLTKDRTAAFAVPPVGPNQVWQLDFSEFATTPGGTWPLAGCRDWYSKNEHPWHDSPTNSKHDAIAAVEVSLRDHEALYAHPLADMPARLTPPPTRRCPWSQS